MIEIKISKNDKEDKLFRINSKDIVGFYNCNIKQERKITDIIKCYGKTKRIREIGLKNVKPEDNVTVFQYIERNVGSIINKDYVIEGFLRLGELFDCKDEVVRGLDRSKRYFYGVCRSLHIRLFYCISRSFGIGFRNFKYNN